MIHLYFVANVALSRPRRGAQNGQVVFEINFGSASAKGVLLDPDQVTRGCSVFDDRAISGVLGLEISQKPSCEVKPNTEIYCFANWHTALGNPA